MSNTIAHQHLHLTNKFFTGAGGVSDDVNVAIMRHLSRLTHSIPSCQLLSCRTRRLWIDSDLSCHLSNSSRPRLTFSIGCHRLLGSSKTHAQYSSSCLARRNDIPLPKRFCAKCYEPLIQKQHTDDTEPGIHCPHCRKRLYCSPRCQSQDWENGGVHEHYCGQSGEINVDYEMRMVDPTVGIGLFAMRPFVKDEIILVESPILSESSHGTDGKKQLTVPRSARAAVSAMYPAHGTLEEKMDYSGMELNDKSSAGLFLAMGMANHDCLGNADHLFLDDWNVRLLVASQTISAGQEIRFYYIEPSVPRSERKDALRQRYGFECTCQLCRSAEAANRHEAQIQEAFDCNERLETLVENNQPKLALVEGRRLLELFDKMAVPESTKSYIYVYLAMFRAAIQQSDLVAEGVHYLKQARRSYVRYTHTDQTPECLRMTELIANPHLHDDYLKLER